MKKLLIATLFSTSALATPVVVERFTFPYAGQYTAISEGQEFTAWCAEQSQYLHFGETIDYTLIDGTLAWGVEKEDRLDRLLSLPNQQTSLKATPFNRISGLSWLVAQA